MPPSFMLGQNAQQDHRRRGLPRLSRLPSVHASARHDGRRLDGALDKEKAPVEGRRFRARKADYRGNKCPRSASIKAHCCWQ
jgi:hypothetical protein